MQGKVVIVRAFGDELLVRKVWSVGQNLIYVTDEKNYDLLINGKEGVTPIGVPREDIFEYDETAKKQGINKVKLISLKSL